VREVIESPQGCTCAYCSHALEFELDDFLLSELMHGNVVIFAGAGVSTENNLAHPHTLYDSVIAEIGEASRGLAFPDAVQKYISKPDGYFRFIKLVEERFDYIHKFSDLRKAAQAFFVELSTLPFINEYVTTNWDRSLEEICCAKPFVYDSDMRFWDIPRRKVLKVHGTIDNFSTLVASREEYDRAFASLHTGLVGAKLKEIFNKRTCIFIGYSLKDEDLSDIFRFVREAQGKFKKTHYFVNPFADYTGDADGIVSIRTSGTHFIRAIKNHFSSSPCIVADEIFSHIHSELDDLLEVHDNTWEEFDPKLHPQALPSALYQDGLIHAYRMVLDRRASGRFSHSCEVLNLSEAYDKVIAKYRRERRYLQVPYFTGYQNALLSVAAAGKFGKFEAAPHYFYNGVGEMDREEFLEHFDQLAYYHKAAYRDARRKMEKLQGTDLVLQMQPWMV
jgi:DNA-binding Lrp family transcriptional regulator